MYRNKIVTATAECLLDYKVALQVFANLKCVKLHLYVAINLC